MEKKQVKKLKSITISGFKSIDNNEHTINFADVTVLIGANGSGKSNIVSFFKMVGNMMTSALQQYIGEQGGASSLLHYGPKVTPKLSATLSFTNDQFDDEYFFSLAHAAQDSLIFTHERLSYRDKKRYSEKREFELPSSGTKESVLKFEIPALIDFKQANKVYSLLRNCKVYQFHDTSSASKLRNSGYINQVDYLYGDGGNLAAFLYGLKENQQHKPYYDKIVRHIKQVFPQFGDFSLQPNARNKNYIMLDWYEQGNNNYRLGAHQLSDGTIRFMALVALLLQPPQNFPSVIILDEPELGLHPSAIVELASLVKIASQHSQIVLATQSPALLDEFSAEQIIVVERDPISNSSIFKYYTEKDLEYWLVNYTLSEIWDKNRLGGRP